MTPSRIAPLEALFASVAFAAGTLLAFAASGEKEPMPAQKSRQAGPGIQALAAASTDVVIADVLETNPRKAIEGARDTVKLKVVRTLLGVAAAGDTLRVYYHLLWADPQSKTLEPARFEKGRRYLVFLTAHVEDRGNEGKRVAYEPTDNWLWVQPVNPSLIEETSTAVRVSHGDARGEWSPTEGSIAGLKGRFVLYRGEPSKGTPIIRAFLELRNTAGGNNTVEFVLDGSRMVWEVVDADGKPLAANSPAGNWTPRPARKVTFAAGESGRLPLTVSGADVTRDAGGQLEFGSDQVWVFKRGDAGPYFLSGAVTIAPTGAPGQWYGTLRLPRVRIPTKPE